MQIGGGSMIFMHVSELCYRKGVKEGGSVKNVLQKGEGQKNLNIASLHLHQPPPPK